jgi:hypothetical protein
MQKNPGFLILYSFIKDALLSKVGIVKVWWEEEERERCETFYGLTDEQFMMIVANPDVEVLAHTMHEIPLLAAAAEAAPAAAAPEEPAADAPEPTAG